MTMIQQTLTLIISLATVFGIFTGIINWLFDKKLNPIKEDTLRSDLAIYRYNVVSFASDLRKNIPHSKFEYDAIFNFIDMYGDGVKKLNITNNLFVSEVEYIKKKYSELTISQ